MKLSVKSTNRQEINDLPRGFTECFTSKRGGNFSLQRNAEVFPAWRPIGRRNLSILYKVPADVDDCAAPWSFCMRGPDAMKSFIAKRRPDRPPNSADCYISVNCGAPQSERPSVRREARTQVGMALLVPDLTLTAEESAPVEPAKMLFHQGDVAARTDLFRVRKPMLS